MAKTTLHCPTCHSPFDPAHSKAMPFCSERCREIDLGRWLDERQGLPVFPDPDEEPAEGQEYSGD